MDKEVEEEEGARFEVGEGFERFFKLKAVDDDLDNSTSRLHSGREGRRERRRREGRSRGGGKEGEA
eukprot:763031-Hanusia_phi.AAC.2